MQACFGFAHEQRTNTFAPKARAHINGDHVSDATLVALADKKSSEPLASVFRFRFSNEGKRAEHVHVRVQLTLRVGDTARKAFLIELPQQAKLAFPEVADRNRHDFI